MSVGHVARELEAAGIPTVIIAATVFRPRLEAMALPRLVLTPFPMGRPLGAPHNIAGQYKTLQTALNLLETAQGNGTVALVDHGYFREA